MSSEPQGHVILGPAGTTLEILKCHRWRSMSHGGRTRRGRIPGMSNLLQAVGSGVCHCQGPERCRADDKPVRD